jgi:hypothetical protein
MLRDKLSRAHTMPAIAGGKADERKGSAGSDVGNGPSGHGHPAAFERRLCTVSAHIPPLLWAHPIASIEQHSGHGFSERRPSQNHMQRP